MEWEVGFWVFYVYFKILFLKLRLCLSIMHTTTNTARFDIPSGKNVISEIVQISTFSKTKMNYITEKINFRVSFVIPELILYDIQKNMYIHRNTTENLSDGKCQGKLPAMPTLGVGNT